MYLIFILIYFTILNDSCSFTTYLACKGYCSWLDQLIHRMNRRLFWCPCSTSISTISTISTSSDWTLPNQLMLAPLNQLVSFFVGITVCIHLKCCPFPKCLIRMQVGYSFLPCIFVVVLVKFIHHHFLLNAKHHTK